MNIYLAAFPVVLDHIFCFIDIAIVCLVVVSCSQIIPLVIFSIFNLQQKGNTCYMFSCEIEVIN